MYRVCVVEENPLIRRVLKSVLTDNEFQVEEFCEISQRCRGTSNPCPANCPKSEPCRNMLILFNCERDSSGIEFLKFVDRCQCPCVSSFKVLYTCEEIRKEDVASVANLHVEFVEKENPAIDMLPMIEKYRSWYCSEKVPA